MKRDDRFMWFGAGMALLALVLAAAFAPSAIAQSKESEAERYLKAFEEVYRYIQDNYVEEVDPKLLFEGALNGMFETLDDPYSYYLDELDFSRLGDTTTGNFGGVGLIISKQTAAEAGGADQPKYVEVVTPIEGTPAFRAGISAGDLITAIEKSSTEDLTIDDVVDQLRGAPGTPVNVTIRRGRSATFDVEIVRDLIEVPTVKSAMINDSIGYIRITNFTPYTDDRVEDAIFDLELSRYRGLIIDLRNNPGGLLRSVLDTADLFLSELPIVSTRSRIPGSNEVYTSDKRLLVPEELPIVVLINQGSASASEILAGALRDNERAMLIGETTYGKASVQDVRTLGEFGYKLTTARYFTPSGRNIDQTGIEPDRVISEPELSEDDQAELTRLIEERRITLFVEANPDPSDTKIDAFLSGLESDGITLDAKLVQRLIRNETNRTNNDPPVFDLEYDLVLQEAVAILEQSMTAVSNR
jgi:carboxyl-terminal processing protease